LDLLRSLLVASPPFAGPESSHLRWVMGACVLFAALCSNMQLLFSFFTQNALTKAKSWCNSRADI
jgi:hypothetical protein